MGWKARKKKAEERPVPQPQSLHEGEVYRNDGDVKVIGTAGEIAHLLPELSYHSTWASPESFSRYVKGLRESGSWNDAGWSRGEEKWYGTKTMEQALEIGENGWKEGAEQVERCRNYIQASRPKSAQLVKYQMVGAIPNIPRAVAGNLLNMKSLDMAKSRKKPVITLISNMSANCGVSSESISNRAAVVAALIDEIEGSGYACEVLSTALSSGYGDKYDCASTIRVKDSNQPVDVRRLAFGIGHTSMFRRLVFADWGTEKSAKNGLGCGLGHSHNFEQNTGKEEMNAKNIYFIPSAESKPKLFKDEKTAMEEGLPYLIDVLKKQGCPAFKDAKDYVSKDLRPRTPLPDITEYDDDDD